MGAILDQVGASIIYTAGSVTGWKVFAESQVQEIIEAMTVLLADNWLKDYLFPIFSAFFSAILGGFVAVYVNKKQEVNSIYKDRIYAINSIIIKAERILNSINGLKERYFDYVKDQSKAYRVFEIPQLKHSVILIGIDPSILGFLAPRRTQKERKWDVARIDAMFGNFQFLLQILHELDEKRVCINEMVSKISDNPRPSIDIEKLKAEMGQSEFSRYYFTYEFFIKLNDDLIKEFCSFLTEFGKETKLLLGNKMAKRYGLLVTEDVSQHVIIQRCAEPDYSVLAKETKMSIEELKSRLKTPY